MKFKPKTTGAVASSQNVKSTPTGGGARKFAVPHAPGAGAALLGGKPRSSVGQPHTQLTPTGTEATAAASNGNGTSADPPSSPLAAPVVVSPTVPRLTQQSPYRQRSSSPAPPRLHARPTPSPSPAPAGTRSSANPGVMRVPSRSASARRSATPSARINGRLALLAAAENTNTPLHIPASMDRKKRRAAANATKEKGAAGDAADGAEEGAAEGETAERDTAGPESNGSRSTPAPILKNAVVSTSTPSHGGPPSTEDIEAIAQQAITGLMQSATMPRAEFAPPVITIRRAGSASAPDGNAEAGPSSQPMGAATLRKKPVRKRVVKRKGVEVDDAESQAGEEAEGSADGSLAGGKKKRKTAAASKDKGKGKGKATGKDKGEDESSDDADAAEDLDELEEDIDMDMDGSQAEGSSKPGRKRKSDSQALQRKKREPMFPRPQLLDLQAGDMLGSEIVEEAISMGDLATVRSAEGRISRKSAKWQDKAAELTKSRRRVLEDRLLDNFAMRRPQRRFIRAQMNAMRQTRRAEVEARGGNAEEDVSADEPDSDQELDPEQIPIRRMSPTEGEDADAERARRVAEEDAAAAEAEAARVERRRRRLEEGGEEGESEGEGDAEDADFIEDEDAELFNIGGKWIRVPRGDTPEGAFSYTLRRLGHTAAADDDGGRRAGAEDDEDNGGGAFGDDFYDNLGMGNTDDLDAAADQYHANRDAAQDWDDDDPNRQVVERESSNAFVNSATWSRKRGTMERWDKDQTDAFYYYLSIFGENFSEMEGFFPERTHRQLKNKSRREQRSNLAKYEAFLKNQRQPDQDELENITSWRSIGRTRAAKQLLAETLLAPAQLAKEDAELRKRRKKRGRRGKGLDGEDGDADAEADAAADGAEDKDDGGGEGLQRIEEDDEADGGKDDGAEPLFMDNEDEDDEEEEEGGEEDAGEDDVQWDDDAAGGDWWQD